MELQTAQIMNALPTSRGGAAATDLSSLADLRSRAGQGADGALKEVAQHFESLFVQMMMKAMRDATQEGGLFNSDEMKFHQGMFDQQMSLHLSQSGGVGLAEVIERQLSGPSYAGKSDQLESLQADWQRAARGITTEAANDAVIDPRPEQHDFTPANPQEFVRELWPHAKKAADTLGVDAEVLVAQAALESGWGKHTIRDLDGSNSFNLFGIKADSGWQGDRATKVTVEYRDGIARKERAAFRAYQSLEQSFDDYVQFLNKPRYQQALAAEDNQGFLQQLQDGGYATDPRYAEKISAVMQRDSFRNDIAALKGQQTLMSR